MPIYEFKCSKCNHFFELLVMGGAQEAEAACPSCKSQKFERVMSTSNFAMGGGKSSGVNSQTRSCSGGSCTTYEIPGPSR